MLGLLSSEQAGRLENLTFSTRTVPPPARMLYRVGPLHQRVSMPSFTNSPERKRQDLKCSHLIV